MYALGPCGIMNCKKDKRVDVGDCWSRKKSTRINKAEEAQQVSIFCACAAEEWRLPEKDYSRQDFWIKSSTKT